MSTQERQRLQVVSAVSSGGMSLRAASEVLGLSYRQMKRVMGRYRSHGDAGLVHGLRGRPSCRKLDGAFKARVLELYQAQYPDFGPTLAAEKLRERDSVEIHHETLRLWLIEAGLWQTRKKKRKHRCWRSRKARFGELAQFDGSDHLWFEERGVRCFLMNMVDDATGTTLSVLTMGETTLAAMLLLEMWITKYGIPKAIYVDLRKVYVTDREPTVEEQLSGQPALTQFGRACFKLGIEIIEAHSPQAKGRVERNHGVHQDRLIKEMRLAGISDIAAANAFLPGYLDKHNQMFAIEPRDPVDAHTPLNRSLDLRTVFCLEEMRVVSNDHTIRYRKRTLQILRAPNAPPTQAKVIVQEWRDNSLHVVWQGQQIAATEITDKIALDKMAAKATPHKSATTQEPPPSDGPQAPRAGAAWKRRTDPALILGRQVFDGQVADYTAAADARVREALSSPEA
jgi:transposase